jgi:CRP/FNR family cyclic AMP-dependent transcriptional regulator
MSNDVEMLARVPLFQDLPRKTLERLHRIAVERKFPAGNMIVEEGDAAAGFFLITDGEVEVTRGGTRLTTLGKNDFFGEMALLDGHPRSASVRALRDTSTLAMTRWDFTSEVETSPEMALEIIQVLTRRLRELDKRVSESS